MITIVNYGLGSVINRLKYINVYSIVSDELEVINIDSKLLLPDMNF